MQVSVLLDIIRHGFLSYINCLNWNHLLQIKLVLSLKLSHCMNIVRRDLDADIKTVFIVSTPPLITGHSSQIHQIHVKSKILKFLKYSPFDSLIENRKFQNLQLHSPSSSDFMTILRSFPTEFEDKMWFGAFSGYS